MRLQEETKGQQVFSLEDATHLKPAGDDGLRRHLSRNER